MFCCQVIALSKRSCDLLIGYLTGIPPVMIDHMAYELENKNSKP